MLKCLFNGLYSIKSSNKLDLYYDGFHSKDYFRILAWEWCNV